MAKVLELQLQHQSFQWTLRVDFLLDGLAWSPCCPRDSQEPSPAPQFESINSSVLCHLYGPTLTFIRDYRKNHSFEYRDLCRQQMSPFFNTQSRFGALGKCKAYNERSFQGKLPGGLFLDSGSGEHGQILRWRASENPQPPGLVTFTLSWGSQRPLLKDLLDYFILCVIGQILDFLLVLKCVEIFIN